MSRANRSTRYEAVRALHQQPISQREIACRLSLSRNTVRKFLKAETFPERSPRLLQALHPRALAGEVLEWPPTVLGSQSTWLHWLCCLVSPLHFQRAQAASAAGTSATPEQCADGVRVSGPTDLAPKSCIKRRLSPTRASWLYVSQVVKLGEKQRGQVEQIRASHADLDLAYDLTQAFISMLAEHRETDLENRLTQAEQSGIRELKSFAAGIRRGYAAVCATFTSRWSNGPVEAQANCPKLQKRLMFGRANFDLLRLHVLRRA